MMKLIVNLWIACMPQERYLTRRGRDLGPQQRIRLPGAAKVYPQKRLPGTYSSWNLGPSWDPSLHTVSSGRTWRAPRNLADAIYEIQHPVQSASSSGVYRSTTEEIQGYLAATLVVYLYDMLVVLVWPDWQFNWDPQARFEPNDERQRMHDILAAWAMRSGSEEPSIRSGGFPPWLYDPAILPAPRGGKVQMVMSNFYGAIPDNGIVADLLRSLVYRFRVSSLYQVTPIQSLQELNPTVPEELEEVIAQLLYRWWAELALPLLMKLERNPDYAYTLIPKPDTAESPFYLGQPWWLVVMNETSAYNAGSDADRALLAASGGAIYSVWLWNPLDIQHYASPHSPITTLYALDMLPEEYPDDYEVREELYDQLREELNRLTDCGGYWMDFSYDRIEQLPRLTGLDMPDEGGAIYDDYFNIATNVEDAIGAYQENPKL